MSVQNASVRDQYLMIAFWHLIGLSDDDGAERSFSHSEFDARAPNVQESPWVGNFDQDELDDIVAHGADIMIRFGLLEVDEDPYAGLMFSVVDSQMSGWQHLEATQVKKSR